jgi:phosphate:Na+ symporter
MSLFMHAGIVLGGIGLLLVGMAMMTDGLKLAAGNALRNILALWTNTHWRGVTAGFFITGLVQSSSAVTVATIGFANAGLLNLSQSIWVIYGSNVGTTMTAWIVALIGFKLNVQSFALPMVGVGMILRLTGEKTARAYVGQAVIGFGLLFLGIGVLADTFANLGDQAALPVIREPWLWSVLVYIGVGFILTSLMQSSSAALVIALSAAQGGVIPLENAALVVIGANLGTTTTALLAVWGATSTAKRVAVSHVVFNLVTASVAALILTPLLTLVEAIRTLLDIGQSPAITLALFHTVFNVLGVILIWPISGYMVKFLAKRFQTQEELESRPRYLDKNVLALPHIAAQALTKEVGRIREMTLATIRLALAEPHPIRAKGPSPRAVAQRLTNSVGAYSADLSQTALPPEISQMLPNLIRATQQFTTILQSIKELASIRTTTGTIDNEPVTAALREFRLAAGRRLDEIAATEPTNAEATADPAPVGLDASYAALKECALSAGAVGQLNLVTMDGVLNYSALLRRILKQTRKASRRLAKVQGALALDAAGNVLPTDEMNENTDVKAAA